MSWIRIVTLIAKIESLPKETREIEEPISNLSIIT